MMPNVVGAGRVDQPATLAMAQGQPGPSIPQVVSEEKDVEARKAKTANLYRS